MSIARYTIGAKIFGAFVAMSAIIGVMGLAGYGVLAAAGNIAVTTFDGPLMAINYARAAQTDFTEMQLAELRYEQAAPAARPAIAAEIADLAGNFADDLNVAAQRLARRGRAQGDRADRAAGAALAGGACRRQHGELLQQLDHRIDEKFDLLIELNTDHSFVGRRQTVSNIRYYKYGSIVCTMLALLLAGGITLFLRRRIIRPLTAAAMVADRISKGELQTQIPESGRDETGTLLKSMKVMQTNIREMMTRETMLRRSAENRLADALETSREGASSCGDPGRAHCAWPMAGSRISSRPSPPTSCRGAISTRSCNRSRPSFRRRRMTAASTPPAIPNWNLPMAAGCV